MKVAKRRRFLTIAALVSILTAFGIPVFERALPSNLFTDAAILVIQFIALVVVVVFWIIDLKAKK